METETVFSSGVINISTGTGKVGMNSKHASCRVYRGATPWLSLVLAFGCVLAQPVLSRAPQQGASMSPTQQADVIEALNSLLLQNYVFPDIAAQLTEILNKHSAAQKYAALASADAFAAALTEDLRSINNDRHLSVWVTPERSADDETNLGSDFSRSRGAFSNYGFQHVEIMAGNVGYVKMSSFSLDQLYESARRAGAATMGFVADADALIFDLTDNGGGSPRLSRFLSSYLFTEKPVHLNDYYFRTSDTTLEYWTLTDLPGHRMPDIPVYILINRHTFSAAEGFAYSLKHLNRATVVGQTSGGGSHGGSTHDLTDVFQVYIPFSRSIHPLTKTDFEGTGVVPDLAVNTGDTLLAAHILALENLMAHEPDSENMELRGTVLERLKRRSQSVVLDSETLLSYVGQYRMADGSDFTLSHRAGQLFGQMSGDQKAVAVQPLDKTRFRAVGYGVEFTINLDAGGRAVGLTIHQGGGMVATRLE